MLSIKQKHDILIYTLPLVGRSPGGYIKDSTRGQGSILPRRIQLLLPRVHEALQRACTQGRFCATAMIMVYVPRWDTLTSLFLALNDDGILFKLQIAIRIKDVHCTDCEYPNRQYSSLQLIHPAGRRTGV